MFMTPDAGALLKDGEGSLIGKTVLGPGVTKNLFIRGENTFDCGWALEFEDVPEVEFLQVEIAGRTVATFSYSELVEADWLVGADIQL